MLTEETEQLSKQLHQLADDFDYACKAGDGYDAHFAIGRIVEIIPQLKKLSVKCHAMGQVEIEQNLIKGDFK